MKLVLVNNPIATLIKFFAVISSFVRLASSSFQDLSGHPLGKKLTRPFEDLEKHLQEIEDTEYR